MCIRDSCKEGVLKNGEVTNIDLSRYPNAEDGKLLTQDLFSALHSENDIVLLENVEQCHKSLLPMVAVSYTHLKGTGF